MTRRIWVGALVALSVMLTGAAVAQQRAQSASGAQLRALDKVTGETYDLTVRRGELIQVGRLRIVLGECRYPAGGSASDAYAWLEIRDIGMAEPAFSGWMLAASPALNALDHPRYDVWVLRCRSS